MSALDELLAKWRENPDSGTTLALCTYLGTSRREDLIREVGSTAEAWHKEDGSVMLAVGRMYMDAALLQEAQGALVAAGKLNQSDPAPYRYLGEVLLRRGDAARAEKVLARALQMGAVEQDTRMWHDRAAIYVALQSRMGMRSVADEIERTFPRRTSIPPPSMTVEQADRLTMPERPALRAGPRLVPQVPPPPRLVSTHAPKLVSSLPPPLPSFRAEAISDNDATTDRFGTIGQRPMESRRDLPTILTPAPAVSAVAQAPRIAPAAVARERNPPPFPSTVPPFAPSSIRPVPAPRPPRPKPAPVPRFDDAPTAPAETVLEHLARVGVYERGGGAPPAWVTPPRVRQRGSWLFVVAMVLAAGGGYGGFTYVRHVRADRMVTARRIEAEVTKLLETAKVEDLRKTDEKLSQVFDLDSRSQAAAILWLRNRVLSALMLPSEPRGIESALARCKTLDIDDAKTAFGRIASFLAEGDLAGAAAIMPKWDERAKGDPIYHLAAGAMLERAGDVRAVGRYQQAFDLEPDLLIARVFHAELVTLELGVDTGKPVVREVAERLGDVPVARALLGLSWWRRPIAGSFRRSCSQSRSSWTRGSPLARIGLPTLLPLSRKPSTSPRPPPWPPASGRSRSSSGTSRSRGRRP